MQDPEVEELSREELREEGEWIPFKKSKAQAGFGDFALASGSRAGAAGSGAAFGDLALVPGSGGGAAVPEAAWAAQGSGGAQQQLHRPVASASGAAAPAVEGTSSAFVPHRCQSPRPCELDGAGANGPAQDQVRGRRLAGHRKPASGWSGVNSLVSVGDAIKVLRAASDQGDVKAQVALGTVYLCGQSCPKDIVTGLRWMRRAAEGGSRFAQLKLIEACSVGGDKAYRWLRAAVAEGDSHAMVVLGLSISRGDLPGGWSEAVYWWKMAAERRNSVAQYYLGCAYLEGAGVRADRMEAIRNLRLAEAQGRQDAKEALRKLGAHDPSAPTATAVLHRAAQLGDPEAQFDLACAFLEGEDGHDGPDALRLAWWLRLTGKGRTACGQREAVEQNLSKAIAWLKEAAAAGVPEAQCNLAVAFLRGVGVGVDTQQAVELLRAAASRGHVVAGLYLSRVGADADSAGGLGRGDAASVPREPVVATAPALPEPRLEPPELEEEEEQEEEEVAAVPAATEEAQASCKGGGDAAAGDEPLQPAEAKRAAARRRGAFAKALDTVYVREPTPPAPLLPETPEVEELHDEPEAASEPVPAAEESPAVAAPAVEAEPQPVEEVAAAATRSGLDLAEPEDRRAKPSAKSETAKQRPLRYPAEARGIAVQLRSEAAAPSAHEAAAMAAALLSASLAAEPKNCQELLRVAEKEAPKLPRHGGWIQARTLREVAAAIPITSLTSLKQSLGRLEDLQHRMMEVLCVACLGNKGCLETWALHLDRYLRRRPLFDDSERSAPSRPRVALQQEVVFVSSGLRRGTAAAAAGDGGSEGGGFTGDMGRGRHYAQAVARGVSAHRGGRWFCSSSVMATTALQLGAMRHKEERRSHLQEAATAPPGEAGGPDSAAGE